MGFGQARCLDLCNRCRDIIWDESDLQFTALGVVYGIFSIVVTVAGLANATDIDDIAVLGIEYGYAFFEWMALNLTSIK